MKKDRKGVEFAFVGRVLDASDCVIGGEALKTVIEGLECTTFRLDEWV
jgi:hypothetical protein